MNEKLELRAAKTLGCEYKRHEYGVTTLSDPLIQVCEGMGYELTPTSLLKLSFLRFTTSRDWLQLLIEKINTLDIRMRYAFVREIAKASINNMQVLGIMLLPVEVVAKICVEILEDDS